MYRLAMLSFAVAAVWCQQEGGRRVPKYAGDPKIAAILQEARYLNGNGAFGAAYQQEDGIDFKEETDADGNRKGSYSYIDPSGQRKTVHYTAGKNGFQASGDHIPTAPQAAAPAPQYKPDPQYNPPDYRPPQQYSAPVQSSNYNPNEDDGQYHPELYERENYIEPPAPRSYSPPPQQQYRPKPQPQYQPQNIYTGIQQGQYSGVQQQQYSAPAQQQYSAPTQQYSQPAPQQFYDQTTPQPTRFFPPGKFSLNRSPDGFTYTFNGKA